MFNWTAFPESLDNGYEELDSNAHSPNNAPQLLPRSASTSQISSSSPALHFDTLTVGPPASTGSRSHQRTPGVGSLSESNSPMMAPSARHLSGARGSLDPIGNGFKAPPNSFSELAGAAVGSSGQATTLLDTVPGCWWVPKQAHSLPDFVLISEFSEVEGPRAVMTIPDNIVDLTRDSYSSHKQRSQESSGKHSKDASDMSSTTLGPDTGMQEDGDEDVFDIHEFVLRITAVDQQTRESSGSFHIPEDIEVHISDTEKGYWAYVHHFTLFDINARGFVRPFSMSYISRDPNKILAHYEDLRNKFSKAALYFKTGNYTLFRQDLSKKLRDLNFTNNLLSDGPGDGFPLEEGNEQGKEQENEDPLRGTSLASGSSFDTITPSTVEKSEDTRLNAQSDSQKADLESIKDAIETATQIISVLEHYSIDGQPLLGHAEDGNDAPHSMAPLSDLSPMTSSENLALLAAGRSTVTDPSLFLGARPGSRISRKGSTANVSGAGSSSRILDLPASSGGLILDGLSAPVPHLLGLQEQSRKNSVVSDYDSMMYEAPEYEAQYVTTLYPVSRDDVVFRPLRELCVATMVWNSSIQFHLGIKKIKDILKDFQSDSLLLGETADNLRRMHPSSSSLAIGQRFLMNFRNPDFSRVSTRPHHHQETPVPLVELLQGISLANAPSDDGISVDARPERVSRPGTLAVSGAHLESQGTTEGRIQPHVDADDADDEETGYDSLDDAASFFTAATRMAALQTDTPTREAFVISPLDRSARVAEWHQEQQTLHHAKGPLTMQPEGSTEHAPWAFAPGVSQGESCSVGPISTAATAPSFQRSPHRYSAQSGTSVVGLVGPGFVQNVHCPTLVMDTLQQDPELAKHLAFTLLSGRKLCVVGHAENESRIRTLVSVLATFLPHAGYPSREEQLMEHQRQVLGWYQGVGPLKVEDMEQLYLVGVETSKMDPKLREKECRISILDYDSLLLVQGPKYTDGVLLESMFRNLNLFSDDRTFLAFVDGRLMEVLLKSFLYYHLVFHGRLYQSGLGAPSYGVQSFCSSGASDDGGGGGGEAYSYQRNFQSSRQQSPMMSGRERGFSRTARKNMSNYPSLTPLGTTVLSSSKHHARSVSVSSHESSDGERNFLGPMTTDSKQRGSNSRRDRSKDTRRGVKYRGKEIVEGDEEESSQSGGGGPMQYTTSQGMRKWKKWFEYWSAKSAAMIDPALAAFGRSESTTTTPTTAATLESPGGRPRRSGVAGNSSGRSSPGFLPRRVKTLPSAHPMSPGGRGSREAREREKERDRERDRDRDRKMTFDSFDISKKKGDGNAAASAGTLFESSDFEGMEDRVQPLEAVDVDSEKVVAVEEEEGEAEDGEEKHHLGIGKLSGLKGTSGLRRLKPKRPLTLHHRRLSKHSDEKGHQSEPEVAVSLTTTLGNQHQQGQLPLSSGSTPPSSSTSSPPPSASFRTLAGALRAMSFGPSSSGTSPKTLSELPTTTNAAAAAATVGGGGSGHEKAALGEFIQKSPRNSHELSGSSLKEAVKRRGSKRAKAKAWFKSKSKRRSRVQGGEDNDEDDDLGNDPMRADLGVGEFDTDGLPNDVSEEEEEEEEEEEGEEKEVGGGLYARRRFESLEMDHSDQDREGGASLEEEAKEKDSVPGATTVAATTVGRGSLTMDPDSELKLWAAAPPPPSSRRLRPSSLRSAISDQAGSAVMSSRSSLDLVRSAHKGVEQQQQQQQTTEILEDDEDGGGDLFPLTIQEIAAQEPTRNIMLMSSRQGSGLKGMKVVRKIGTPATTTTATAAVAGVSSSNNSSRVSSTNGSRITSPTLNSFSGLSHQRGGGGSLGAIGATATAVSAAAANVRGVESRSEVDESENDRSRKRSSFAGGGMMDPGKESATEYETSMETFGPSVIRRGSMDSASGLGGSVKGGGVRGLSALGRGGVGADHDGQEEGGGVHVEGGSEKRTTTASMGMGMGELQEMAVLTAEEEVAVREMMGGVRGEDDWAIIVYLANMVDEYERSKVPVGRSSVEI